MTERNKEDEREDSDVRAWEPGDADKTGKDAEAPKPTATEKASDAEGAEAEGASEATAEEGPETDGAPRRPLIQTPARVIIALVCAVIAAISLLWIGGEQHYQSCVTAAAARSQGANDPLSRLVRGRAINECSHWPF